jgi:Kef-type K+ transport system membrane component KefB
MQANIATVDFITTMFIIFTGASILATFALYTRQTILCAYIVLGIIVGPGGLQLITDPVLIEKISQVGIVFLLFLLGLSLPPQNLLHLLRSSSLVTVISSIIFAIIGYVIAKIFSFSTAESLIVAACTMFSSTIISLKLLPTLILHHKKTGEIVISILLLQDILAIILILCIGLLSNNGNNFDISNFTFSAVLSIIMQLILMLPGLIIITFIFEYCILNKLYFKFDTIKEYVFLLTIGWCLGIAQLAEFMGLSYEIGAFIAGVALATSRISLYI